MERHRHLQGALISEATPASRAVPLRDAEGSPRVNTWANSHSRRGRLSSASQPRRFPGEGLGRVHTALAPQSRERPWAWELGWRQGSLPSVQLAECARPPRSRLAGRARRVLTQQTQQAERGPAPRHPALRARAPAAQHPSRAAPERCTEPETLLARSDARPSSRERGGRFLLFPSLPLPL